MCCCRRLRDYRPGSSAFGRPAGIGLLGFFTAWIGIQPPGWESVGFGPPDAGYFMVGKRVEIPADTHPSGIRCSRRRQRGNATLEGSRWACLRYCRLARGSKRHSPAETHVRQVESVKERWGGFASTAETCVPLPARNTDRGVRLLLAIGKICGLRASYAPALVLR